MGWADSLGGEQIMSNTKQNSTDVLETLKRLRD